MPFLEGQNLALLRRACLLRMLLETIHFNRAHKPRSCRYHHSATAQTDQFVTWLWSYTVDFFWFQPSVLKLFARFLDKEGFFFFLQREIVSNRDFTSADFRTTPTIGACKRSDLVVVPRPHYAEPPLTIGKSEAQIDHTRSYTSVSLTLRPPSSEPQPPIDIRSEGSSLTYSTSSLDPRGFQSRLQISIGPGNVGSVAAARIRPPMTKPYIPPLWTQSPLRSPGTF